MALIKYTELARHVLLEGVDETMRHLGAHLRAGKLKPADFSLRELAESLIVDRSGEPCGREWVRSIGPRQGTGYVRLESIDAVDSTAFSNITGQIVFSELMQGYSQAAFIGDQLVRTIPTKLITETMPGINEVSDNDGEIHEGMPYPQVGFGEDWVETPKTTKRGLIIAVTKEAIFFDRTGQILDRARSVGDVLRRRKEKLILRGVLGLINNFKWKGTTYNTYLAAGSWINQKSGNGIDESAGWRNIDVSEQIFNDMVHPDTGEPITVTPNAILHMPARTQHFRRVFNATELRTQNAVAGDVVITANTVTNYSLLQSRFAYRELIAAGEASGKAADWWLHGDFKRAFAWMENWPVQVVQAPPNSEAEFRQDIAVQFKASERGAFAVLEPRAVVRNYATSDIIS